MSKKTKHPALKCFECGKILVSRHHHDFKSCEHSFIDGGGEHYVRFTPETGILGQYDDETKIFTPNEVPDEKA